VNIMTDETNVAVTTEAPTALKSTDTSYKAPEVVKETKPEPKKVEPKVEPVQPPEGESDAPDADSPQSGKEKRLPRWMKERLERERQVTEARTRASVLQEIQDRQSAPQQTQPQSPKSTELELKTLQDFDFDQGAYIKYMVKVERDQEKQAEKAEVEQKKQAEAHELFNAKVDAFEEKAGDGAFEDIKQSKLNLDPSYKSLVDIIQGDDNDLEVFHHLAMNMSEAERIKALPRLQQVREIAKLAEQFEGGEKAEEPKPVVVPKKTTSAPPPVKTVSGAGKPSVDIRDPAISTADRIKAWKKQGGR
jgi:hypothetical protein